MPTLLDLEDAQTYERHATRRLKAFLKFDVGLERLGAAPENAPSLGVALRALHHLELRGVYTHLHVPPHAPAEEMYPYLQWQFARFKSALEALREAGIEPSIRMAASSGVLMQTDEMHLNAVDPGHLLFGMYPSGPRRPPAGPAARSTLAEESPGAGQGGESHRIRGAGAICNPTRDGHRCVPLRHL